MSVMLAALNPNISNEDLLKLIKHEGDNKVRLIQTFGECLDGLETKEQKVRYMNACSPVLLMAIF